MFNRALMLAILMTVATYCVSDELPNPDEDNLANFHLKDETCAEQCHQNESVSEDLVFEYQSCIECHGSFEELDGKQHTMKHYESEQMECVECHLPHEEFDPKEICTDCHDEGDEELEGIYASRLIRYLQQPMAEILSLNE